ncbi:MAG: ribonuclease J [Alphaproteobacteria bacterium]|nr:ribonuclease J [Alphaproteobacteria bacterium]
MEEKKEMVIPRDDFVFIPLGGATGIGMNFFAYGYQGKWLLVDCGVGFPGDGLPGVDVLLPNPVFLADKKQDIVGLVITHAHEDHIGAIPHLWRDLQCPIYATPFAAELIESKLNESGLLGRADLNVVERGSELELPPFDIEFISMCHSIPEPNALAIKTPKGTVVHTGDWKLNQDPILGQETDVETLKNLGKRGVLALVCDSTNVFGEPTTATESDVQKTLTDLIGQYPDKQIAVTCFASNVARVKGIYQAAKANGRDVCLMGRSLWRMDAAARATGYFHDIPEFLSEREAMERPVGTVLYICTGSQGESRSALASLSTITPIRNSVYFGPDDVVIFSSRIIPGNEKAIALLQRKLKAKGCKIITDREEMVHVSGHYAGQDLQQIYQLLMPKIALPVHGESLELNEHARLAKKWGTPYAFALEDGEVLNLSETPEILGQVETGILAVDGKQILRLDSEVIRKRRKMMDDGSFVVTLVVDRTGTVLGEPQISTFGLLDTDNEQKAELIQRIKDQIAQLEPGDIDFNNRIDQAVRTVIRKFLDEFYGKHPLIDVHLVRV